MNKIEKKVWPDYFQQIFKGKKTFDVRLNDFRVEEGDILVLREWDPTTKDYTGRTMERAVGYVGRWKIGDFARFWPREDVDNKGIQVISIQEQKDLKYDDGRNVKNIAFVDGQNLYMNTAKKEANAWRIDLARFRVYLEHKYCVDKAYYFLGYVQESNQELYEKIQNAGFILVFRDHSSAMIGKKKGNVDSDIIFHIMKKLYKQEDFNKIILVSGDGDYKLLVDFLIEENRFKKILFPDKKFASSLYRHLGSEYFDYLEERGIKDKIEVKKKRAP